MSRETSPYIVGERWLDKRRDGKAPNIWQIATACKRSVVYRSTHCRSLDDAKATLDAWVAEQRALTPQAAQDAQVIPMIMAYWKEHGRQTVNHDQTGRSLRTFIGFLLQDRVGVAAVVTDLTPVLFDRFRRWRMAEHHCVVPWAGGMWNYDSKGVVGATVQRNINDVRAAVNHAEANLRIPMAPKIKDLDPKYRSAPRERVLTLEELSRIAWYAKHNADLFRFFTLQLATAVRPMAALKFNPVAQYDERTGLIDLQPEAKLPTKKRNAVIPAIRPMRVVIRAWAAAGANPADSRKTAWRIMRRVLALSTDVHPKTIRHTVATLLYADESVPEREIVELLGHEGNLARTTRIYAKYDPTRLRHVRRALSTLWLKVSRLARAYGADHMLTTGQRGDEFRVVPKPKKAYNS
jgi:integrase